MKFVNIDKPYRTFLRHREVEWSNPGLFHVGEIVSLGYNGGILRGMSSGFRAFKVVSIEPGIRIGKPMEKITFERFANEELIMEN